MKICIAQTKPAKGDIAENLRQHVAFIERALLHSPSMIVFPELSLTGYEPDLAKVLATTQEDRRLDVLQALSDENNLTIGVGLPTKTGDETPRISMVLFRPRQAPVTYSKCYLFATEEGIFSAGEEPLVMPVGGEIVAPAICYELSNPKHSEYAYQQRSGVYIASVLNSVSGVDADLIKLEAIAKRYKMNVFMANYVGISGGYNCAGKSSVWNKDGVLVAQLDGANEGLIIFDTKSEKVFIEQH